MADKITEAKREDNPDGSVHCYHISYEVENSDATKKNSFVVVVHASEMTTPTDASEAKTIANGKALTKKTEWENSLSDEKTQADEATIEGEVTL